MVFFLKSLDSLLKVSNGSICFNFISLSDGLLNFYDISLKLFIFPGQTSNYIFLLITLLDLSLQVSIDPLKLLIQNHNLVLILCDSVIHVIHDRQSLLEFVILDIKLLDGLFILLASLFVLLNTLLVLLNALLDFSFVVLNGLVGLGEVLLVGLQLCS